MPKRTVEKQAEVEETNNTSGSDVDQETSQLILDEVASITHIAQELVGYRNGDTTVNLQELQKKVEATKSRLEAISAGLQK